jgi:hypothetical protein
VNDDELGRALATALAAPDVQAAPDAGAKLRARARRQRAQQWAVGAAVTAVLAVLLGLGLIRAPSELAPVATGVSYGHSLLRVPLAVQLSPVPCPIPVSAGCPPPPVVTLDEVLGLRVTELPESGAIVEVTLTRDDDRTMARTPLPQQAQLTAVAGTLSYPAMFRPNIVRIRVPTPELADELVALLAPYQPVARTGPGRLDRPLQVWWVRAAGAPLCAVTFDIPHTSKVNRLGECLFLAGPVVTIDAADVRIRPPSVGGADWVVTVDPSGPARRALADWTAGHAGQRIAVGVAGQLVGPAPELAGTLSSLEIPVADRGYAVAVVSRMRP